MTAVVPGNFWELDGELGAFAVFARGEPASSPPPAFYLLRWSLGRKGVILRGKDIIPSAIFEVGIDIPLNLLYKASVDYCIASPHVRRLIRLSRIVEGRHY